MKSKVTLTLFSLLFLSHAAMAMHAYATDSCTTVTINDQTISAQLGNDVPAAPHILGDNKETPVWVSFDQSASSNDMPASQCGLVLKVESEVKTQTASVDDGCFQGSKYTSIRKAQILAVTADLVSSYQIQNGDQLTFVCYHDFEAPSGPNCSN